MQHFCCVLMLFMAGGCESSRAAAVAPVRTRSVGTSPGDSAQPGISPWQLPWVAPGPEASDRSAVLELLDLAARHFMQPTAATTAYNVPVTDGIWSQVVNMLLSLKVTLARRSGIDSYVQQPAVER